VSDAQIGAFTMSITSTAPPPPSAWRWRSPCAILGSAHWSKSARPQDDHRQELGRVGDETLPSPLPRLAGSVPNLSA
jgi:hypothetical protein